MQSFIKNSKILDEDYQVEDLLDFSTIITDFKNTLEKIEKNTVIGLRGKYGSGKSTMLFQIYKDNKADSDQKWIVFDAWKFPERNDLWEGFVLETAKSLDKKLFEKARRKIDGTENDGIKNLVNVLSKGANLFLPGAGIAENFTSLFNSSPARRVFELQEVLNELIKQVNKDIYIVVEDIDRSGDKGVYFLETLRNYIKTNQLDHKLIIIVPIAEETYSEGEDSYSKSLDYLFDFKISKLDYKKFISEVFKEQVIAIGGLDRINLLFKNLAGMRGLTIRKIKTILRMAEIEYKKINASEDSYDPEVFLGFSALSQLKEVITHAVNGSPTIAYASGPMWIYNFLIWNAYRNKPITEASLARLTDAKFNVTIIDDDSLTIPEYRDRFIGSDAQPRYLVSNKYLYYLSL